MVMHRTADMWVGGSEPTTSSTTLFKPFLAQTFAQTFDPPPQKSDI